MIGRIGCIKMRTVLSRVKNPNLTIYVELEVNSSIKNIKYHTPELANVYRIDNDLLLNGRWGSVQIRDFFPGYGKHLVGIVVKDGEQKIYDNGKLIGVTHSTVY